ncbi:heme peroxidase family protein [Actinosynnema sp. NPDC023587]|uniref:peroxidase family protein n=1 Tax=Actinosynnema sp. NPDC023587 TaxID=3154695 RepID=UPI0033EF0597
MKHHGSTSFFVVGEGVLEFDGSGEPAARQPLAVEELRRFRFSRMGPEGVQTPEDARIALAEAMTAAGPQPDSADPAVPAGFTYLGQFVDHDLTMDRTESQLGGDVNLDDLVQGRSPALDLDSVYGRGPLDPTDRVFYAADQVKLKVGRTSKTPVPDNRTNVELEGFDLPRAGSGVTGADRRRALIPDLRNDENLAVAQTHLAFIRFHNRVVDELARTGLSGQRLFQAARAQVVRHYQWMLRHDHLPRVVDPAIVDDVFATGRRFFEAGDGHRSATQPATMPLEFSVAAYRLGHSMIRGAYQWNRVFRTPENEQDTGALGAGTLLQLFTFSGTSGNFVNGSDLDDPNTPGPDALPTNWVADFRRLYDFTEVGRPDLAPGLGGGNVTKLIDSLLVDPLTQLPAGTFEGRGQVVPPIHRNLAFRNLTRANMVRLASGQQMASLFDVEPLTAEQILVGNGGARLDGLPEEQRAALVEATPLWFYTLREAEFGDGLLGPVGGRIVAEVFHRSMESSRSSIVREPYWRPEFGPDPTTFRMTDLLLFAFEGKADLLNPLGD